MRNPEASDFCYYPFMQILLTSDGRYRPCSKHQDYITHQGRELSIHHGDDMQDAWTSDYMQDIRQHFLENRQFEGCRECWRMQRMGLRSMRYDSYQYGTSENQVSEPITPTRIEINASNICNLRCRICYPNASSKWIKEHGELYGSNEKVYRNLPLPNLEQVKGWTQSLEEVCFFGGEPLLSEENMELLDHFISSGNAERMSLLFNTNGTVFSEEIIERLRPFKRVRMYFSVDDIGDRFEYQRKGANWDEVAKNIEKAYRLSRSPEGQNIDFKICCTVSILNIYYFPEFFDYFGKNFPGLRIFWNLLFDPWRLNVQILPRSVKLIISDRLKTHVKSTYTMSEPETKTIEELVTFMNEDVGKPFDEFFWYVNRHDTYRDESFRIVFDEFYQVIKEYQPESIGWTIRKHANMAKKAINDVATADDLYRLLSSQLKKDPLFKPDNRLALQILNYHRIKLESNLHLVPALYSAFSGVPTGQAKSALTNVIFSRFNSSCENGTFLTQNVEVIRVCLDYSEELLFSLACLDKKTLLDGISQSSIIDLVLRIDDTFGVFTAEATKLLSNETSWNHPTIFSRVADVLSSDKNDEQLWVLLQKWSELLCRSSEHVIALFSAAYDLSSESVGLAELLLSFLHEAEETKHDSEFASKIVILRTCLNQSDHFLASLLLNDREKLAGDLCGISRVELLSHIENNHQLFGAIASKLISGVITWEECTIFNDCADACFHENDDSGRWVLCEQWSFLFRDSSSLIPLFLGVLNLESKDDLSTHFISEIRRLSVEMGYDQLSEHIELVEDILLSVKQDKVIVEFIQEGRISFLESLRKHTIDEVLEDAERKYGFLSAE
ncbi:MAG: twitch domain-containing radical SAM protein [Flavobacteriales bacterium]|nr:twitch domain-containing radical SAM protein [Flavobacteriales bacterium]